MLPIVISSTACQEPSTPIDGVWVVDFGRNSGVLQFYAGDVSAYCYAPHLLIGSFSLDGDSFEMSVNFNDGSGDLEYEGALVREDDDHLRVDVPRMWPLRFERYRGDCSEVYPDS